MIETNIIEVIIAALMLINAILALIKAISALKQKNPPALFFQSSLAFAYIIFPAIVLWPDFIPYSLKIIIELCIVIVLAFSLIANLRGLGGRS